MYHQLAEILENQISSGTLHKGEQIPTETQLCAAYGVSRITVRKGIETLVEKEILVKKPGIGTFVAETKLLRRMTGIQSFTENCAQSGRTASSELLAAELITATAADRELLKLPAESKVIRILRLRLGDGIPIILEDNHFPPKYAFLLAEDLTGSLYQLLRDKGIIPTHGSTEIDIRRLSAEDAALLQVSEGTTELLTRCVTVDQNGEPIHTGTNTIILERYRLTVIN